MLALALSLGYLYAFVSGFTDAANSIATSIGSRVLAPRPAVLMAGLANLAGGLTGTAVALTIGRRILDPEAISLATVVAGVAAAMTWSLLVYVVGIPVSETHGLIAGLIGAGAATGGWDVVETEELGDVFAAILASPALGFLGGLVLVVGVYRAFFRADRRRVMPVFVNLQRVSAAFMAFSHGRNDAQKPIGVLALALALHQGGDVEFPAWVTVSAAATAAAGTTLGGWRIIETLSSRLVTLDPVQGFAAETAGASVMQAASQLGIPVSTTHTITTSIMGAGASRRLSAVRWGVSQRIFTAWVLTVPVAMVLGAAYGAGLDIVIR